MEVYDPERDEFPVHVPLSMLFGDLPISNMKLNDPKIKQVINSIRNDLDLSEVIHRVLSHPSVASKSFLITIGDRTVGGLVARDQLLADIKCLPQIMLCLPNHFLAMREMFYQ